MICLQIKTEQNRITGLKSVLVDSLLKDPGREIPDITFRNNQNLCYLLWTINSFVGRLAIMVMSTKFVKSYYKLKLNCCIRKSTME